MRAVARVAAELASGGRTRLTRLRSCPPLVLKATPDALYLVGGAAGPLGGDDLHLHVHVGREATLVIRSAAACLALPGPGGQASRLTIDATVAAGGRLRWLTEPTVACAGCNHRIETTITLERGAMLVWREELMLGRYGERPGEIRSRLRADSSSRPVIRNEIRIGSQSPGWDGPAVLGRHRAIGSILIVHPGFATRPPPAQLLAGTTALLPLEADAALITALAPDAPSLRTALKEALRPLTENHTFADPVPG